MPIKKILQNKLLIIKYTKYAKLYPKTNKFKLIIIKNKPQTIKIIPSIYKNINFIVYLYL